MSQNHLQSIYSYASRTLFAFGGIVKEYFELISETLIFVFFVMTFLLQSFVIPTGSMKENLLIGDHLLVDKVAYSRSAGSIDKVFFPQFEIQRGMIVTFKSPTEMEKDYVKRVIGLPGETVKMIRKKIYINGKLLDEPYTFYKDPEIEEGYRDNFPLEKDNYDEFNQMFNVKTNFRKYLVETPQGKGFKVPPGYYFCFGDNRDNSSDCRFWGPVPEQNIIGKPWRIYWSFDSKTEDYLNNNSTKAKMKDILKTIINFIPKTRWNRTIKKVK